MTATKLKTDDATSTLNACFTLHLSLLWRSAYASRLTSFVEWHKQSMCHPARALENIHPVGTIVDRMLDRLYLIWLKSTTTGAKQPPRVDQENYLNGAIWFATSHKFLQFFFGILRLAVLSLGENPVQVVRVDHWVEIVSFPNG
jgi:hypothetical protein